MVLWQIYRRLLKGCRNDFPEWRAKVCYEMRKHKGLTSKADVDFLVEQAMEVLRQFDSARAGDEAAQLWLDEKEEEFATWRHKRNWSRFWVQQVQAYRRPKRIPHHSGALLSPTLYNRPLPRYKPVQPTIVSVMIFRRRVARLRRVHALSALSEVRTAQLHERNLMMQLDATAAKESAGFEHVIRDQVAALIESSKLEQARKQMIFDPKILIQAKRARRAKARVHLARKHAKTVAQRLRLEQQQDSNASASGDSVL